MASAMWNRWRQHPLWAALIFLGIRLLLLPLEDDKIKVVNGIGIALTLVCVVLILFSLGIAANPKWGRRRGNAHSFQ